MNKICPHCKSPLPEEANFCLKCFTANVKTLDEIHKTRLEEFLRENGFQSKGKKR